MKDIGIFGIIMGIILLSVGGYALARKEIALGIYFNIFGGMIFVLGIIDYLVSST